MKTAITTIELLGVFLCLGVISYILYGLMGTFRLGKREGTYKSWMIKIYPIICLPFFIMAWEFLDFLPKSLLISLQITISIGQFLDGNFYEKGLRFNCFYLTYKDIESIHIDNRKLIIRTKKKNNKSKRYVQRISKGKVDEVNYIMERRLFNN